MLRVAVLVGGGGSNLQALIDNPNPYCEIVLVISHVANVKALDRASLAGIESVVIPHKAFENRAQFDQEIGLALENARIDLVCMAGFMRVLGADLVSQWQGRMINIHPSLLPAFKGLNTHQRAIDACVAIHGCSVHQVTPELDDGPILVQGAVPVKADDDAKTLAQRVLAMEHRCYPFALDRFACEITTGTKNQGIRLLTDF